MADLENFVIPNYDKGGIYAIINKSKMRAYIGQSTRMKQRAMQHKTKIEKAMHEIEEINKDFEDEFSFLVLHRFYDEDVPKGKLDLYEKLYMLTLSRAGFELYNKNGTGHYKSTEEIAWRICCDMMFNIGTDDNLKDAYFEKYKKHYSYDIRVSENKRKKKH